MKDKKLQSILPVFIFSLLIYSLSVFGADLRLGKKQSIKSIGITMRMPKGFESRPIRLPDMYYSKGHNIKFYKTPGIWRYKQHIGRWGNNVGTLTVAEMAFPVPSKSLKYITIRQVKSKFKTKSKSIYWSKSKKLEWLELFIDRKINVSPRSLGESGNTIIEYYPIDNGDKINALFILSNKSWSNKSLLFMYSIKPVFSQKKIMKLIFRSIKSVSFKKVEKEGRTSSKTEDPIEEILRSIEGYKDWWSFQAGNYLIVTNYPKKSRSFINKIKDELEQSQTVFSMFYKRTNSAKDIYVVRLFRDHDDFVAYVGKKFKNFIGIWLPLKKELAISRLEHKSKRSSQSVPIEALRHEAFHQYIYHSLGGIPTSVWFNEGNAVFFQAVEISANRVKIKSPKSDLKLLKEMIKKPIDISRFLNMGYKQFYAGDGSPKNVQQNYALAWGIVYFIYKGAPAIKSRTGRDYTKILSNYYKKLIKTKNPKNATERAWSNINMKQFTADFVNYFKRL